MGEIRENLKLQDSFSGSFTKFIQLGERAAGQMMSLEKNVKKAIGHSTGATIGAIRSIGEKTDQSNVLLERMANTLDTIAKKQKDATMETEKTSKAAGNWMNNIKGVLGAIGAVSLGKAFFGAADEMSSLNAKMKNLASETGGEKDLMNQIYLSAQRSRSSFSDTATLVAKIGNNAGDAFDHSNAQILQFSENLNKLFKISGATAQEQSSATLQLTQALASGVLRGEELNAVFEAAPNIIQTVADYMDVPIGQIRSMAAEGELTADVVKNALLGATDEINESFSKMPMTLADAFTMGKNAIKNSLRGAFGKWTDFLNSEKGQEILNAMINGLLTLAEIGVGALELIGNAALWVYDHMDAILPILIAVGAGYLALKAVSVASALAAAAGWAIAHWPLLLIIGAIALAIYAAREYGATWEDIGAVIGGIFGYIYGIGYNLVANLWNLFASIAEFFANVWNDPVGSVVRLFAGVFDTILGIVETVANAIDTLLHTDMASAVSGFRGQVSDWVTENYGEAAVEIQRMANLDTADTLASGSQKGAELGSKIDNLDMSVEGLAGALGGIDMSGFDATGMSIDNVDNVGKVKSVDGEVSLSDEDIKLYRDLAERTYMANVAVQTLAPSVNVSIPETAAGTLSADDVAEALVGVLNEQRAANSAVSHEG